MAVRKSGGKSGKKKRTSARKTTRAKTGRKAARKSGRKTARKAARKTTRKTGRKTARKSSSKRELIEPNRGDKRYVRRKKSGRFSESDNVSRSLSQDVRKKAKRKAPAGQGDRGD